MTTTVEAFDAVRAHIAANFVALPISFGNDDFEPETHGGENGWAYVTLGVTGRKQVSMCALGHRTYRSAAQCHAWVYVPRGSRVGAAEAHAAAIQALFADEHFTPTALRFVNVTMGDGVPDGTDGRWWGVPVFASFTFDTLQ